MPAVPVGAIDNQLTGRTALVAGAASGIGRATALLLAAQGANVLATDVDQAAVEELASSVEAPLEMRALRLDVTSEADWQSATTRVIDMRGRFDILVVSAGITHAAPIDEISLEAWRRVMAINLDGAYLGTKYAVRAMRAAGNGGSIVLVSSASGIKAAPGASAYAASKAGLRLFARSIALECASDGIRVNTVHPAGVRTPMWTGTDFWAASLARHDGDVEATWSEMASSTPMKRFCRTGRGRQGNPVSSLRRRVIRHRHGASGRWRIHGVKMAKGRPGQSPLARYSATSPGRTASATR